MFFLGDFLRIFFRTQRFAGFSRLAPGNRVLTHCIPTSCLLFTPHCHLPTDTLPHCEQMLESSDCEVRCAGAKVLSLLLRGKMHQESHVGVKEFFALDGLGALQRSLLLETSDRQVEMGGLWLQERGGARVYVQELLSELPCAPCSS